MFALSLWASTASSECFWMDSRSRAGWPSLRTLALQRANLSTKLSTATFDGAQQRTCTGTKSQISKWSCHVNILFLPFYSKINCLHLLALFYCLQDDLNHRSGFSGAWRSMNHSQFSLWQSKGHCFSLRIIQVWVKEFNLIWWNKTKTHTIKCSVNMLNSSKMHFVKRYSAASEKKAVRPQRELLSNCPLVRCCIHLMNVKHCKHKTQ